MSQKSTQGSGVKPAPKGEMHLLGDNDKLVVTKVEVIKQREIIKVPEIVIEEVPTIKYNVVEQDTVRYDVNAQETVRYDAREEETVKYITKEEETIKYVPKEVVCEKPILVEKPYERPVVTNKEYTIVTYADLEAIRELLDLAPKLLEKLKAIKDYQIVKEVIKVPDLKYVPTTIKRIAETGELIQDANT